jgi:hypothetical protein
MIESHTKVEKEQVDIGQAGAAWMSTVLNPFGSGESTHGPIAARPCDGNTTNTNVIKLTGSTTFSGATATSGFIQCVGYAVNGATADQDLQIVYGVDCTDPSATCTAVAEAFHSQYTTSQIIASGNEKARMICSGLRVAKNDLDTAAGELQAYDSDRLARTAAATWVANSLLLANPVGDPYAIKDGITVRKNVSKASMSFVTPPTAIYTASPAGYIPFGTMPLIRFSGLSATTILSISWVSIIEVTTNLGSPLVTQPDPYEPEWEHALVYMGRQPLVTSASTFKSFLQTVWKDVNVVGQWVWNHRQALGKANSAISSLIK